MIRNGSRGIAGATYVLDQAPPQVVMHHFDGLPQSVRAAIANASFAYDPREIARRIAGGVRPERIVGQIQRQDRRFLDYLDSDRASS